MNTTLQNEINRIYMGEKRDGKSLEEYLGQNTIVQFMGFNSLVTLRLEYTNKKYTVVNNDTKIQILNPFTNKAEGMKKLSSKFEELGFRAGKTKQIEKFDSIEDINFDNFDTITFSVGKDSYVIKERKNIGYIDWKKDGEKTSIKYSEIKDREKEIDDYVLKEETIYSEKTNKVKIKLSYEKVTDSNRLTIKSNLISLYEEISSCIDRKEDDYDDGRDIFYLYQYIGKIELKKVRDFYCNKYNVNEQKILLFRGNKQITEDEIDEDSRYGLLDSSIIVYKYSEKSEDFIDYPVENRIFLTIVVSL